jgi:hypothetical protein
VNPCKAFFGNPCHRMHSLAARQGAAAPALPQPRAPSCHCEAPAFSSPAPRLSCALSAGLAEPPTLLPPSEPPCPSARTHPTPAWCTTRPLERRARPQAPCWPACKQLNPSTAAREVARMRGTVAYTARDRRRSGGADGGGAGGRGARWMQGGGVQPGRGARRPARPGRALLRGSPTAGGGRRGGRRGERQGAGGWGGQGARRQGRSF